MGSLLQDLRYSVRTLRKSAGLTTVAVITLALGIGANTAIFSLIHALLLRPVTGVEDPERIVMVYTSDFSSGLYGTSSFPDYLDFKSQASSFQQLAAYADNQAINLSTGGEAERVAGAIVTGDYFPTLGMKPLLGRVISAQDDQTLGGHPVAMISYEAWRSRFGGDSAVIGKTLTLNGYTFNVVGVAPENFHGIALTSAPAVWVPMKMFLQTNPTASADLFSQRNSRTFFVVGRLKPQATIEQAQSELNTITAQLAASYPKSNRGTLAQPDKPRPVILVPANTAMSNPSTRDATKRLTQVLMAVVGLVLLIGCANVANLLLARASARQKEFAVRVSLGASRQRILRQLLTESLLLSLVGGATGLMFAMWMADAFRSLSVFSAFVSLDLKLDVPVLTFTFAVSILTGVLFGLAPALQASRSDLVSALKDSRGDSSHRGRRFGLRDALVVFQVALSMVLLLGAGLLLRTLHKAYTADLGFDPTGALMASVDMQRQGYKEPLGQNFYREFREAAANLPGVEGATLAAFVPVSASGSRTWVTIAGYTPQPGEDMELSFNIVDENYFHTLRTPIVLGRNFAPQDVSGSPGVIIVNQALAQRFWPGANPIGKRISLNGDKGPFLEVVGVTRNGKYRRLREEWLPYFYLPLEQNYRGRMTLIARSGMEPAAVAAALRDTARRMDANLPVYGVRTLEENLGLAFAPERSNAALIGGFSLLALMLAAVGLYGVMSYAVGQRTREIGVRMALGAQRSSVFGLVLGHSMKLAAAGLVIGIIAAFGATRLISAMLYGVSATDVPTFLVVAPVLAAVMLLAGYVPAHRATRVDPMIALRYE